MQETTKSSADALINRIHFSLVNIRITQPKCFQINSVLLLHRPANTSIFDFNFYFLLMVGLVSFKEND